MAEEIFTYKELFQYKVTEPEDNKFVETFRSVCEFASNLSMEKHKKDRVQN